MKSIVRNPERASQVLDFTGMLDMGTLYPTDIDGLIEWRDKAYLIFECKYRDAKMPIGQKIALERMVKDFHKAGKRACAIQISHDISDSQESVLVDKCLVRQLYLDVEGRWRRPRRPITAGEFSREFIKWAEAQENKEE